MPRSTTKKQTKNRVRKQIFGKKYDDSIIFDIYDLVKNKTKMTSIAKQIGIAYTTLLKWTETKPIVALAIKQGELNSKQNTKQFATFENYVEQHLPPDLLEIWEQITDPQYQNTSHQIQIMLETKGKLEQQQLFIHSLVSNGFNVSAALRVIQMSRGRLQTWCKDRRFGQMLDNVQQMKKDFFEHALFNLINRGDTQATIFANKTINRDRGYGEKTTVEHTGTVNVQHNVVSFEQLDLDLDTQKKILQAIQQQKIKQIENADFEMDDQ